MARPKKHVELLDEALTAEEINEALAEYIDYGVKIKVTDLHWMLSKGKLSVSGSLSVPVKAVKEGADFLVAQERFVRVANRKDRNGNLAIGNIIDKSGNDISHGE